jgi:inorganic triphosphatase YgiF
MTDPAPREVEAKFTLDRDDRQRLADLQRVGSFRVTHAEATRQVDTYFDSVDRRLAEASSSLRLRRKPSGALMTFKGAREPTSAADAHVASRLEDEVRVPDEDAERVTLQDPLPDMPSLAPLRRARSIVSDAPLIATAQLDNERITLLLADSVGATLELAIDHVTGTRLSDGRQVIWDEVELEAKGASRELLLHAAAALRKVAPSLRPSRLTKLERVLGDGDAPA